MRPKRVVALAVTFVLLCGCMRPAAARQAADPYAERLREFEAFVPAAMKSDHIPGMTVGFFRDGYTGVTGFGYADLENRAPAHA
ncbi:MAG TPA: hypothetical protein VF586_09245, partial [Pyrinomonadaceae bacterium]